jgi:membrane-bound lytic murein transglycosylase MltF
VRKSSSYYESLLELNQRLKQKGLKPVRIQKADEELETEDILELVNSGAVKITVSDSHLATIWSKIFHDITLRTDLKVKENRKIAWMVRKNNPLLRESLNKFLKTHKKGTLLGNIYFNRYYKNTKWIKNPLSKSERIKLERYKRLFKKYARIYGFDRMLIMALAYQESGLDNNKKSHIGAVGVMQILPRTAADKRIGISDVHKVENNIHAGVKYLAFLRDRYFNEKQLRERDRVRFALAAYNAGPAKIKKARALARKMGLNPDRWFRNVEMAVLKIVGQETVRYVSNINKYYLLFKAAFQWEKVRQEKKS